MCREHDVENIDCWCKPKITEMCSNCSGIGCYACENGFLDITEQYRAGKYLLTESGPTLVIVHNEI